MAERVVVRNLSAELRAAGRFPRRIFRCFAEERHARSLLEGTVFVSTIGYLRRTTLARGDPDEATMGWYTGTIDSEDDSPSMRSKIENLARTGMVIEPGGSVKLFPADDSLSVVESNADDGYLICTTTKSPSKAFCGAFGNHCIQIANPEIFVRAMQRAMLEVTAASFFAGFLDYSGRTYRGSERIPAASPFLGPPGNAPEAEFRLYWPNEERASLEPFELRVPEIARLCSIF